MVRLPSSRLRPRPLGTLRTCAGVLQSLSTSPTGAPSGITAQQAKARSEGATSIEPLIASGRCMPR
eukprot:997720-Amphidinium_carterae.1